MNPEFRRYIWRSFSAGSVLLPLVVIGLGAYVLSFTLEFADISWVYLISAAAVGVFFIMSALACSVSDEVAANTWDFQRMSGIGPWRLYCGKMLGAGAYGWYLQLVLAAAFLILAVRFGHLDDARLPVLYAFAGLISGAVVALAFGVLNIPQKPGGSGRNLTGGIAGAGFGILVYKILSIPYGEKYYATTIEWYGIEADLYQTILVTVALYCLWGALGGYAGLRHGLRYPRENYTWVGFLGFNFIYLAGFLMQGSAIDARVIDSGIGFLSLVFSIAILSAMMFEHTGLEGYKRFRLLVRTGGWGRGFHAMPCWLLAVPFQLVSVALFIQFAGLEKATPLLLLLAYMYRDIALFHAFVIPSANERAALFFFVLLGVYYFLITRIFGSLFSPFLHREMTQSQLMVAAIQLALAVALVIWRFPAAIRKGNEKQATA